MRKKRTRRGKKKERKIQCGRKEIDEERKRRKVEWGAMKKTKHAWNENVNLRFPSFLTRICSYCLWDKLMGKFPTNIAIFEQ